MVNSQFQYTPAMATDADGETVDKIDWLDITPHILQSRTPRKLLTEQNSLRTCYRAELSENPFQSRTHRESLQHRTLRESLTDQNYQRTPYRAELPENPLQSRTLRKRLTKQNSPKTSYRAELLVNLLHSASVSLHCVSAVYKCDCSRQGWNLVSFHTAEHMASALPMRFTQEM